MTYYVHSLVQHLNCDFVRAAMMPDREARVVFVSWAWHNLAHLYSTSIHITRAKFLWDFEATTLWLPNVAPLSSGSMYEHLVQAVFQVRLRVPMCSFQTRQDQKNWANIRSLVCWSQRQTCRLTQGESKWPHRPHKPAIHIKKGTKRELDR